jgi:hypothetical protein
LPIGGAVAFGAAFLPFWQAAYPATDIDPAVIVLHIPAQDLTSVVSENVNDPASASFLGTVFWAFRFGEGP